MDELASLPISSLVDRAARTLILPGGRAVRSAIVDASTSFDSVASMVAKCVASKNRLDRVTGNTEDHHMVNLRHMWPIIVAQRSSRVMLDDMGRILAASLCFDPLLERKVSNGFQPVCRCSLKEWRCGCVAKQWSGAYLPWFTAPHETGLHWFAIVTFHWSSISATLSSTCND